MVKARFSLFTGLRQTTLIFVPKWVQGRVTMPQTSGLVPIVIFTYVEVFILESSMHLYCCKKVKDAPLKIQFFKF